MKTPSRSKSLTFFLILWVILLAGVIYFDPTRSDEATAPADDGVRVVDTLEGEIDLMEEGIAIMQLGYAMLAAAPTPENFEQFRNMTNSFEYGVFVLCNDEPYRSMDHCVRGLNVATNAKRVLETGEIQ